MAKTYVDAEIQAEQFFGRGGGEQQAGGVNKYNGAWRNEKRTSGVTNRRHSKQHAAGEGDDELGSKSKQGEETTYFTPPLKPGVK